MVKLQQSPWRLRKTRFPFSLRQGGADAARRRTRQRCVEDDRLPLSTSGSGPETDTLLARVADAVIATDTMGRVTAWEGGAEWLFGYSREQAVGESLYRLIGYGDIGERQQLAALAEDGHWSGEMELRRRDGNIFLATVDLSWRTGRAEGLVCTVRDATALHEAEQSVDKARQWLEMFNSVVDGGHWEWRLDTRQAIVSRGWRELLDWRESSLLLTTWEAAIHPEDRRAVQAALASHFSGAADFYECEYRLRSRQGAWIPVYDRGRVNSRDTLGQPTRMMGVTVNRTRRRDRDQELSLMQEAVAASPAAIMIVCETGKVRYANNAFREIWNLPDEMPVESQRLNDLRVEIEDWNDFVDNVRREGQYRAELSGLCGAGMRVAMEVDAVCVTNDQDGCCILSTWTDVTERKRELDQLRENVRDFRRMLDCLPAMIWVAGRDRECVYFNRQWLEFTGRDLSEERGQGWIEGVHPEDREELLRAYESAFSTLTPLNRDFRLRRGDGEYRLVQLRGMPWRDETEEFGGFIGSCFDITEKMRTRKQLEEKRDLLAKANRVSMVGEMASGLAHELNQPLAAIKAYASGCCNILDREEGDLARKINKPLQHISVQAARAADIIRSLRSLVRRRQSPHEAHDIVALIDGVLPIFQMESNNKYADMQIEHEHPESLPDVHCDAVLIQQVLLNLIRNGAEAAEDCAERKVIIRTEACDGNRLRISVLDSGPGMSSIVEKRALYPFFTTKSEGLGMGLSICQTIVEEHGGGLDVSESELGGAQLSFTLPIAR